MARSGAGSAGGVGGRAAGGAGLGRTGLASAGLRVPAGSAPAAGLPCGGTVGTRRGHHISPGLSLSRSAAPLSAGLRLLWEIAFFFLPLIQTPALELNQDFAKESEEPSQGIAGKAGPRPLQREEGVVRKQ